MRYALLVFSLFLGPLAFSQVNLQQRILNDLNKELQTNQMLQKISDFAKALNIEVFIEGATAENILRAAHHETIDFSRKSEYKGISEFVSAQERFHLAVNGSAEKVQMLRQFLSSTRMEILSPFDLKSKWEVKTIQLDENYSTAHPLINLSCIRCKSRVNPDYLDFYLKNEQAQTQRLTANDFLEALVAINTAAQYKLQNLTPGTMSQLRALFAQFDLSKLTGSSLQVAQQLMVSAQGLMLIGGESPVPGIIVSPINVGLESTLRHLLFKEKLAIIEEMIETRLSGSMTESKKVLEFIQQQNSCGKRLQKSTQNLK